MPPLPAAEHVIFANGDRLPVQVLELVGQHLHCRWHDRETWPLPLSALSVVWLTAPAGPETDESEDGDRLLRRLATETRRRDVLLLRNGDVEKGILTGLDAGTMPLDTDDKKLQIERSKVAAIALNTELTTTLRPRSRYGRLILPMAGVCPLAAAQSSAGQPFTGTTLFQTRLSVPPEDIVGLYLYQGVAVYFVRSETAPSGYQFLRDRSLALGGRRQRGSAFPGSGR